MYYKKYNRMNLKTLQYYINKETGKIAQIFINIVDWSDLLEQVGDVKIYINSWFILDGIKVFRNLHIKLNYAQFILLNGYPKEDNSYSDYTIEVLTEEEKIIRNIIE